MEVRIVRDGSPEPEGITLDTCGEHIARLTDDEWVWIDTVEPTEDELTELGKQLELHELVIEDLHHRDQRAKVELYPKGLVFAALRPLSLGADGLVESELFVIVSTRFLVTLRFPPVFDLADATHRWQMLA